MRFQFESLDPSFQCEHCVNSGRKFIWIGVCENGCHSIVTGGKEAHIVKKRVLRVGLASKNNDIPPIERLKMQNTLTKLLISYRRERSWVK